MCVFAGGVFISGETIEFGATHVRELDVKSAAVRRKKGMRVGLL